jgi:hypothetical protein
MSTHADWITAAIAKGRQQHATVPEAVWTQLEVLLRGRFSQGPMTAMELASVAMQLIERTAPAPTKVEGPQ